MHRNLLGFAAILAATGLLLFGAGYLLRSTPSAQAQSLGPVFTGGTMPLLYFSGSVPQNQTSPSVVYTVPAGKTFVLTSACMNRSYLVVTDDGAEKWAPNLRLSEYNNSAPNLLCSQGNGQIPFTSGSEVGVAGTCAACSSSTRDYTIQGYLVSN